jgi:hypothetical protein
MKTISKLLVLLVFMFAVTSCREPWKDSSDGKQQLNQESITSELVRKVGLPAIHNGYQMQTYKDVLEKLDQANLATYTYLVSAMSGKPVFLSNSIGYGIPASTQYTSPSKIVFRTNERDMVMPQADPNGLFSGSTHGTYVQLVNPKDGKPYVAYIEPDIIVLPFKLPE